MKKIILYILVVITISLMGYVSYIHFNEETNIIEEVQSDFDVLFDDTSDITIVNSIKNNRIEKHFNITNTLNNEAYFNISLNNVINNYEDRTFYYEIYNNNNTINTNGYLSKSDEIILSNIKLDALGSDSYTLVIDYLGEEDTNTYSSKIVVSNSNNTAISNNSILTKILYSNVIKPSNNINYYDNDENGLYYTNNSNNGNTIYYFRGDNTLNNNILINNMCFKILRTTENNGIRIVYDKLAVSGSCNNKKNNELITSFNSSSSSNAYIGFMYGSANSNEYKIEHINTNNSNVLNELNKWYQSNINDFADYLVDSDYCNNKTTSSFEYMSNTFDNLGYSNNNTGYESFNRLTIKKDNPTYKCLPLNTFNSSNLSNMVGLLSADELVFAGYDEDNFLNNGIDFWTMTPAYFYSYNAYNYYADNGIIKEDKVSNEHALRPVITINANLNYVSGDGSENSPYQISK